MLSVRLPYHAPYDWQAILAFLAARALPGVELVDGGRYLRSVALEHAGRLMLGAIEVAQGAEHALSLTVHGLDASALPAVSTRVRRIFDLDVDPAEVAATLGRDPVLAPLVARHPGLRVPGAWDGFELAVRGIVGQQITVVGARRLVGKLVATHGDPLGLPVREALTHVFPSPARVAVADLSMLGMPGARRESLRTLAARTLDDPSLFERGASLLESVAKLRSLPGIGEWTAQYIAMRALKEPDAFLAADVGLHRALAAPDGTRPTPKQLLAQAEAWRPHRAYAALHLWTSLAP